MPNPESSQNPRSDNPPASHEESTKDDAESQSDQKEAPPEKKRPLPPHLDGDLTTGATDCACPPAGGTKVTDKGTPTEQKSTADAKSTGEKSMPIGHLLNYLTRK